MCRLQACSPQHSQFQSLSHPLTSTVSSPGTPGVPRCLPAGQKESKVKEAGAATLSWWHFPCHIIGEPCAHLSPYTSRTVSVTLKTWLLDCVGKFPSTYVSLQIPNAKL